MTLLELATAHHAKTVQDTCGEPLIILGRPPRVKPEDCCHIFDYGKGRFGLVLLFDREVRWNNAKKRLLSKGFELSQDGDTEGVLLFDPFNEEQVRLAFKYARVQKVKQWTPEGLASFQENARKRCAEINAQGLRHNQ